MSIKRTIITTIVALAVVAVVAPGVAQGVTIDELLAQIALLQQQLVALQSGGSTGAGTGACAGVTFTRNLTVGSTGSDVKCLQSILNQSATTRVAITGAGSPGGETSYFGQLTLAAVKVYQVQHGWTPANQVGPLTRAALNASLGGVVTPGLPPVNPPVTPVGGGLSVGLAYDTPAMGSVPNNGNANFTKVTLTAGSGDVSISRIYITRTGLSSNSALENIKIVDAATGAYTGSIGSLNTDNKAMITFTQNLVIPANTSRSFYLKAGVVSSTTTAPAGNTAVLGIAAASDITSNASSVTGTFPATGNSMTFVNLTIGSTAVAEDGATTDSKPNVGDVGVVLNQFKITAGSTEAVTVEAITMLKAGTVSNSYLSNLELYDVTNAKTLGTVASLNAEGKAIFGNLNLSIGKGNTQRFKIKGTIVDGPTLTANADITDGSEVLVVVKGQTYGYYITPTSADASWASTARNGQGTADQTVAAGALVVSKSSSTPATGNTSAGDDKLLAVYDFNARGESVKVSSLKLTAVITGTNNTTGGLGGLTSGTEGWRSITNIRVYDESGTIVAGPKDLTGTAASITTPSVTFTDTFIVPVGTHKYSVKAKLASGVVASDTIHIDIVTGGATDITAKGMTSNSTITSTGTAVGNNLTVKGATLSVTGLAQPAARSVAVGTSDFLFAAVSLSAVNSGEDIQVTGITVNDDVDDTYAYPSDLSNMALWADLTSANSTRGDVYETRISNTENPTIATSTDTVQSFTLNQTITVPAGKYVNIAVVASLKAGATVNSTSATHTLGIAGATATGVVTANGASTGTAATITYTVGTVAMINASGGVLTITKDSTSPVADLVLGNSTVALAVFRLASSNVENLDVDEMTLEVTGGTVVDTYYFYNGTTPLGSTAGGTAPKIVFADGTLTVPANGHVKVTVKGVMSPIISGDTATTVTSTIVGTAAVKTTGLGSGTQITSGGQQAIGSSMVSVKAKPTVTFAGLPLAGTLYPSTSHQLAIFNVTGAGVDDVTFGPGLSNHFIVNINRKQGTSDYTAGDWTIKDEAGTTLDTVSVLDQATSVDFIFATSTFSVAPGETKKLYVYGDTHEYTTVSDSIQLYLSDSANGNCVYSVGAAGSAKSYGTYIFRGGIYGNTFSRPST